MRLPTHRKYVTWTVYGPFGKWSYLIFLENCLSAFTMCLDNRVSVTKSLISSLCKLGDDVQQVNGLPQGSVP